MVNVNCNLCGSPSKKILHKFGESSIVSCNKCDFVYTETRNKKGVLTIYKDDYFHIENSDQKKQGYRFYEKDKEHHIYYFEKKLNLIKFFLNKGKILDVGCALGFFMEAAEKEGFDSYGVDVSDYAISYALKKFPKRAFLSTIKEANFKRGFFDCITMFQTLEHLDDPLGNLIEANKVLKKNGFLVIATPNHNCIIRKIMGKHWFEYKPEEHLNYFDEKSLGTILEKTGYKIECIEKDMFFYPLGYILERFSYYCSIGVLKRFFYLIYKAYDKLTIKNARFPLPLGGMVVVAQKI